MKKDILPGFLLLWVPELKRTIRCKVDTGADNSAVHLGLALGLPTKGTTTIKSSSGKQSLVPQTELTILGQRRIVNLTDRTNLLYGMIIGRSAIRDYLVDPDWDDKEKVYGT